jgi:hypothetical protein
VWFAQAFCAVLTNALVTSTAFGDFSQDNPCNFVNFAPDERAARLPIMARTSTGFLVTSDNMEHDNG